MQRQAAFGVIDEMPLLLSHCDFWLQASLKLPTCWQKDTKKAAPTQMPPLLKDAPTQIRPGFSLLTLSTQVVDEGVEPSQPLASGKFFPEAGWLPNPNR
ncbi:hypothetical protein [Hymenobacter jeollabukensis]|uniref:Uncharacterized protein n=1 Tax=Hymenobacter jeollabukensis TaxID=2025313 RepID=A0A5R8WQR6_9BACT|nr:hypothetical protein [Hymenobacter jeollabukensis]TLM92301.1 hypothetical protein FDY95_12770 [Hymenobacter jeollabukensis]